MLTHRRNLITGAGALTLFGMTSSPAFGQKLSAFPFTLGGAFG